MLDVLRRGASTWVSKLLLGLLIVSFAVWGIADVFRGFGSNTIVSVGSRDITAQDFDFAYRRELDRISQQVGRPISREQALAFGMPSQILSQLVQDATFTEQARRLGIGVSNAGVADQIRADPAFQTGGKFDRAMFSELLRRNGWTEDTYIVTARDAAKRQQLIQGLIGGMAAPKTMLEATNQFLNEERKVAYVVLPPSVVGTIDPPSDADLAKYYEDKKGGFRAPEYRDFAVLVLDAASITKASDVTDDDVKAEYERQKSRYTQPERRRVDQLAFDKPEDAAAAADRIKAGTSFDEIVKEKNLKPEDIDLGLLPKDGFLDPAVADAAFALAKAGDVSAPVKGRFSTVLVRLADVRPAGSKSLDEVKDELRAGLAKARAEDEVGQRRAQIEDALAGGAKLADIAKRFDMKIVQTGDVTRDGKTTDGKELTGFPEVPRILRAAWESDVGVENEPIAYGQNGYIWYEVSAIKPAHDRPLDEVRADVVARWIAEQTKQRLAQKSVEMVAAIQGGKTIEEVATAAGLKVETAEKVKRTPALPALGESATQVAFEGPEGHVGTANGPNDSRIVLKVTGVEAPVFFAEAEDLKTPAHDLEASVRDAMLDQYLRYSQSQLLGSVNSAVLQRTIGAPTRN